MTTVVIYLGGEGPTTAPKIDDKVAAVIAADSGLDLADAHGMMVNLIVGDFDSVNPETVTKYVDAGSVVEEYPREKEVTDFELALLAAKDFDADKLVIIGGGGQRLDHLLGNMFVLSGEQTAKWIVDAFIGRDLILLCRKDQPRSFEGIIGDSVSLIPIGSDVGGVTTSGLKWKLTDETLNADYARGMSNELSAESANVKISSGSLAVVLCILKSVEGK